MICTSIAYRDEKAISDLLSGEDTEMAEIRLDLCPIDTDAIARVFSTTVIPLIATCRISSDYPKSSCLERLKTAIEHGASYADIETEVPRPVADVISALCREHGCRLIRSLHDFSGCPDMDVLQQFIDDSVEFGADIIKIAVSASARWKETIDGLYKNNATLEGRLIAFAMGKEGRRSRLNCIAMGAPFTYCAPDNGFDTAPGQYAGKEMRRLLYAGRSALSFDVRHPAASKSYAQRTVIAAALADGKSVISGYTDCNDSRSAVRFASAIGAEITELPGKLEINGIGAKPQCLSVNELFCGESGLLTRIAGPLMSALNSGNFTLTGHKSLMKRNMKPLADALEALGKSVSGNKGVQPEDILLPFSISGMSCNGGHITIDGSQGSQNASGMLFCLPLLPDDSVLEIRNPKSTPYLDMTVSVLNEFGIRIAKETASDSGNVIFRYSIKGGQSYKPANVVLEPDWSGAAPFLVLGAIAGRASVRGMNLNSLQADSMILDILHYANAFVRAIPNGNGQYDITVSKDCLRAFDVNLENAPDLFPIAAVLASFCHGSSHLTGVGRLHSKESDRAQAIMEMLHQMGVSAETDGNTMTVTGENLSNRMVSDRIHHAGTYRTHHDHRMAMALMIVRTAVQSGIVIDDTGCIDKSYPGFMQLF